LIVFVLIVFIDVINKKYRIFLFDSKWFVWSFSWYSLESKGRF